MKRLLLILFVLILPLQSVWAAASAYCTHEGDASTQHFGHHTHEHETHGDSDPERPSPLADNDCGLCHLGHCFVASSAARPQLADSASVQIMSPHLLQSSSLTERPERPKWSVLA